MTTLTDWLTGGVGSPVTSGSGTASTGSEGAVGVGSDGLGIVGGLGDASVDGEGDVAGEGVVDELSKGHVFDVKANTAAMARTSARTSDDVMMVLLRERMIPKTVRRNGQAINVAWIREKARRARTERSENSPSG